MFRYAIVLSFAHRQLALSLAMVGCILHRLDLIASLPMQRFLPATKKCARSVVSHYLICGFFAVVLERHAAEPPRANMCERFVVVLSYVECLEIWAL